MAHANLAEIVLTWDFPEAWYHACPRLRAVLTPAAGRDWVDADPNGRVEVHHGTFHGPLLAESLLGALLAMNHRMPQIHRNQQARTWDRNLQAGCRMLSSQRVLIVGMGHIGTICAERIAALGATVAGIRRRAPAAPSTFEIYTADQLAEQLRLADHTVLLLPGEADTDSFMGPAELAQMKPSSFIYNFGRGNALRSDDLLPALTHLGGAWLDVTDLEPLPENSPLWSHPKVVITPHTSCVYDEYLPRFLAEAAPIIRGYGGQ